MLTADYIRRLEDDLLALEEMVIDYVNAGCEDLKDSIPEIEQRRRERQEMKQAGDRTLRGSPAGRVAESISRERRKTRHD